MFNMNIKALRKELNMTQKELSEKSKVSQSSISKLENNSNYNLGINTFSLILRTLKEEMKIKNQKKYGSEFIDNSLVNLNYKLELLSRELKVYNVPLEKLYDMRENMEFLVKELHRVCSMAEKIEALIHVEIDKKERK